MSILTGLCLIKTKKSLLRSLGILLVAGQLSYQLPLVHAESTSEVGSIKEIRSSFEVDDHHQGHQKQASYIPNKILNPDDSDYVAPELLADYIGYYQASLDLESLEMGLEVVVQVTEDGLFNLAYYFTELNDQAGIRFYENSQYEIEFRPAIYQDLVLMTGGFKEADGGLSSGLIQETISPVILLDEEGEPYDFYPYMALAYGLREDYSTARIYQNVGLYISEADQAVLVDINHLIGNDSEEALYLELQAQDSSDLDQAFLVEKHSYEVLQEAFDHYLMGHDDFTMNYDTANEFVQEILAMQLMTNASFPADTGLELIEPEQVRIDSEQPVRYALAINNQLLFVYDGERVYMSDDYEQVDGFYQSEEWLAN